MYVNWYLVDVRYFIKKYSKMMILNKIVVLVIYMQIQR